MPTHAGKGGLAARCNWLLHDYGAGHTHPALVVVELAVVGKSTGFVECKGECIALTHGSRVEGVAIGGGGVQGGRIVGKSDKWAMDPDENPYGPEDLCATVYHLLGIDPRSEMHKPDGRPIMLTNNGRIIKELL